MSAQTDLGLVVLASHTHPELQPGHRSGPLLQTAVRKQAARIQPGGWYWKENGGAKNVARAGPRNGDVGECITEIEADFTWDTGGRYRCDHSA